MCVVCLESLLRLHVQQVLTEISFMQELNNKHELKKQTNNQSSK